MPTPRTNGSRARRNSSSIGSQALSNGGKATWKAAPKAAPAKHPSAPNRNVCVK